MALVISGSWQNVIVSNKCVQWLLLSESTRGESLWRQEIGSRSITRAAAEESE